MNKLEFFEEKKCEWCGRIFCPAPQHVFKFRDGRRRMWFCKYTCMLRWREKTQKKKDRSEGRDKDDL